MAASDFGVGEADSEVEDVLELEEASCETDAEVEVEDDVEEDEEDWLVVVEVEDDVEVCVA